MRSGFTIIELLMAFAIITAALIGASLTAYALPKTVQGAYLELALARAASTILDQAMRGDKSMEGTTTTDGISSILQFDAFSGSTVFVTSSSSSGSHTVSFQALVAKPEDAAGASCQPFLSGEWVRPRIIASYLVSPGALLPSAIPDTSYPVSSLEIHGNMLAVGIATTTHARDPSLFFFRLSEANPSPAYIGGVDTAPASRVGVAALASDAQHVYVANRFSSVSTTTCAMSPASCAQLQIIDTAANPPVRIGFLQTSNVPANAIVYRNGYVYLGLGKTLGGQEFQVIGVQDPIHPLLLGGTSIGHSITDIDASEGEIVLATDDNASTGKALISFDVHDPLRPVETGSFRFPGAGFARSVASSRAHIFTGRTYATGTSEEFSILGRGASSTLIRLGGGDIGTNTAHRGVYAILIRDFMAFLLTDAQLQLWNITDPANPSEYAHIDLPRGIATAFACRENTLYVGSIDNSGNGYLTVITST